MNKEIKKIFFVLFFFALSDGVLYNFQELWMSGNNLSTKTISVVFSLCALLTVSTIFLCSNLINTKKIKKFSCFLSILKILVMFALFLLNGTGYNSMIKFLVMADYVIDIELYACIYPMISYITKDNKIYAIREILYRFAYSLGMLLTGLLLGKMVFSLKINFNTYCLIACILMIVSYIILKNIDLEKYIKCEKENSEKIFNDVIIKIKKDKITQNYLLFVLFGNISLRCISGLLILLLTTKLGFTATLSAYLKTILGIVGPILAVIIIEKLTLKNNYINISIKLLTRALLYLLAFLTNHSIFFILSIIHARLLEETYLHITDAPYVNRFKAEEQLAFCNLKEMAKFIAVAIGTLLCGVGLNIGTRYIFLFALIFLIIQIVFAFRALNFYRKERQG